MPSTAVDLRQLAEFPTRFTKLRSRLGMPKKELARWLGVSADHVSQLEHGRQVPSAPLFHLFEKLEAETTHHRLVMHEPVTSEPAPIALGLPPEALAVLDQLQSHEEPAPGTPAPGHTPSPAPAATLAQRVKAIRDQLGVTRPKLAAMMGVCRQYITKIENGKGASKPIIKLVEKFEAELRAQEQPAKETEPAAKTAAPEQPPQHPPLLQPMAPGVTLISPRLAALPLISMRDALLLSSPLHSARFAREHFAFGVTDPEAFAVRINGDSMQPLHVDGEIAIVYPQSQPRTGDRVMVRVHDDIGGAVLFRIYTSTDHGRGVLLTSPNPVAPPINLNRDEILWICPVASTVRHLIA
ncbi:MAG: helix-turn-helix domain-containing protein [Prosthecobacter sp.]|nr:helix-turn-helix domain-containing protein [Prosthecobacter sp.]